MTTIYFVRHCKPDHKNPDDRNRPLTDKTIAIGTHGTALSSIINYYEPAFNADSFLQIINWMPYILKMNFDGKRFLGRENVFYIEKEFKD